VDPKILMRIKPPNTDLDKIGPHGVISLVAFEFQDTNVKGIPLPVFGNFCELNLRYNVKDIHEKYSGVVFINELVPRELIAAAANTIYNENYETINIKSEVLEHKDTLKVNYFIGEDYVITAETEIRTAIIPETSEKSFIIHRNAGFGINEGKSIIYKVEHGNWEIFPLKEYSYTLDFGKLFGSDWEFLNNEKPFDVTVSKGSNVNVYDWKYLEF